MKLIDVCKCITHYRINDTAVIKHKLKTELLD